jgi:micrococcal nuclease
MIRRRSRLHYAVLFVAVLTALVLLSRWLPLPSPPSPDAGFYRIERVVDGDTLLLRNQWRVRLIGADTPETVAPGRPVESWGPEATEFTRRFVAGGNVRLEFDGPRKDKYDRYLAHVWVGEKLLEEELIRAGLATAETQYSYSAEMKNRFRKAEAEAQAAARGIWSMPRPAEGNL